MREKWDKTEKQHDKAETMETFWKKKKEKWKKMW